MAENIILTDIASDPFKDQNPLLTNVSLTDEGMIHVNGLYHKTQKITFNKSEDIQLSDIITGEVRTYINSKIITPVSSQEVTAETPTGTPTYELKTVRSFEGSTWHGPYETYSELERYTNYTKQTSSFGQRHIVFDSLTPMVGTFDPQSKGSGFYNRINMTYSPMGFSPGQRLIPEYFNDADDDYNLNIYERFQILVGHYSNSIKTLNNIQQLTLKMVFDNFGHPFPEDAYYTISKNEVDVSYNSFIHEPILGGMLEDLSRRTMNYKSILSGNETPNEILFFRVEKWFSGTPSGTPNQVFFIPATDDNKLFIDTQIREDKTYYYRATAYSAVMGQEYFFSNIIDNGTTGECVVEVRPKINLYDTIMFEGSLLNIPAPPLSPFVSFHNKVSSEGKIKIYLELQKNGKQASFIPISNADINKIGSDYVLPNGEIQFNYAKGPAKFQIFRTSNKPNSYNDFSENSIGTFENTNMTENMVILDNVKPNKKYYYTFRTINKYSSLSNPSPVFEVELIKDADESRILVNSFLFINTSSTDEERGNLNFRSLLQMSVAPQQIEFDIEDLRGTSGTVSTFENKLSSVALGYTEMGLPLVHKIWGRKFKFRVRSNDSGKIIDFNVKVNLIKEEDFS